MTGNKVMINRGDIYYADLDKGIGSEQGGTRPVVVVQNNIGNKFSPTTIVAPITSRTKKNLMPTHVALPCSCGLDKASIALTEQIRTIDCSRLSGYICRLDDKVMLEIDRANIVSLGVDISKIISLNEQK